MTKRRKRVYTPEFRAEAVRLAKVGDRSLSQVARDLSLHDSVLRDWIAKDAAAAVPAPPDALSEAERRELVELRREVRQLREDREILKNCLVRQPYLWGRSSGSSAALQLSRDRKERPTAFWRL